MKAWNKLGWRAAVGVTAIASATVIALAAPASAHVATGPPDVSCDEASVALKDFPQTSTITFHVKVNGTQSTKATQFSGPSGTASVSISDLTTATGSLAIEAFASWTIDGGGKSDTTKVTKVCHEEPTTTTGGPIEVGGIQAERPAVPASADAAAAVAVSADPKFTG
jgi:anti-sigma-K factor RskA